MEKTVLTAFKSLEERIDVYLEHLRLASQTAKDQKFYDEETLKTQSDIQAAREDIMKLKTESEFIAKDIKSVEKDIENLKDKLSENEKLCCELNEGMKMTQSDSSRLSKARNMWYIGEDITGINWNYSMPENIVSGYITNKTQESLEPFEFDMKKSSTDQITNKLWTLIGSASSEKWNDIKESFYNSN